GPGQDLVAGLGGLGLVDPAEAVGELAEDGQVDAGLAAEAVGLPLLLVPAGHGDDLAAELLEEFHGVLGDVPEALHAGYHVLGVYTHLLEGFADGEDHAVTGRLSAPQRAAHAHRLAGDEARVAPAVDALVLVEHPEHV